MSSETIQKIALSLMALMLVAVGFAADPEYQAIPQDASQILASGIADATGPGGTAYVEYWVWNGGNGYYYYTYQIHNTSTEAPFEPFVKHLTIGNPSGEPYFITSSSGGGDPSGTQWCYAIHASLPTVIDWIACDPDTVIYPGGTSWEGQYFQYASALPPSSAMLTIREGSLATYANGLIPSPGSTSQPRSPGYWGHQYSGKGKRKEAAALPGYMNDIEVYSAVFASGLSGTIGSDLVFGDATLANLNNSVMREKAKRQLFALWLNITSHKLDYYLTVTFDPAVFTTTATTVGEAIEQIEAAILDAGATDTELENVKDMAEMLNHL